MKSFLVPPYNVRVLVTDDPLEFFRKCKRSGGPDAPSMDAAGTDLIMGMATSIDLLTYLAYFQPHATYATYFHEALHLAHYIMEGLVIPISLETTEVQAYLMEYIAEACWNKLR